MRDKISKTMETVLSDRLTVLSILICFAFSLLIFRLFSLQIIQGEQYKQELSATTVRTVPIEAPRGNIYDRYGRPLAVNEPAFNLKFDPSVQVEDMNTLVFNLLELFEVTGQEYVDDFPISKTEPYVFLFDGDEKKEKQWKKDMGIPEDMTAEESMEYLASDEVFDYPDDMTMEETREALAISSEIYMQRYRKYNSVTLAYDVNNEVIARVEEENEKYPGVYIDIEPTRYYPEGIYFSHILGYTGRLSTQAEYDRLSPYGYDYGDTIGKSGLEKEYELELSGDDGEENVEVNSLGKRMNVVSTSEPVPGNDIYLTLDANLQKATYEILEDVLTQILMAELRGFGQHPISQTELFVSMVDSNNISMEEILNSPDNTYSSKVRDYVYGVLPTANTNTEEDTEEVKQIVMEGITSGYITNKDMVLILYEQGIISGEHHTKEDVISGRVSTLQVILDALEDGEITPQMTNLDPCTGSVVVVEVDTGNVLAAVSYPSYDNNELANNFNNTYYKKIMNDPTQPMMNRPFMEARAPGSTFKMITGIAALENGVITPTTQIYDDVVFTKAGKPYIKSWSKYSFGYLNVSTALEVSSNYFFSDIAYMLGNASSGTTQEGIAELNYYMEAFGLNDRTGVEITEYRDTLPDDISVISSPEYQSYIELSRDSEADPVWTDGNTVQTSIGQGYNNYTSASMAKYIATLATGGDRYKFTLIGSIEDSNGEVVFQNEPQLETHVEIAPENLQAIYDGMLLVTEGSRGTAKTTFKDFPIRVAGKTGTAQQSSTRNDHASFGGFAPYEDPQIAVYVMIPYGDQEGFKGGASIVAREVIATYMGLYDEIEYKVPSNSLEP